MLTTARNKATRLKAHLSSTLFLAAVSMLTVGNGVLYTLIVIMGECADGGSCST